MKVLAFGEILWDIIEGIEHLGGAPFNFAAHSAQCGNESYVISRLGSDNLGMRAFNQFKRYGVLENFIQWDRNHATGSVDVKLNNGQPDYVIHENAAYDFINLEEAISALHGTAFDVFYFGSLAQRNFVSARTLRAILDSVKFKHVFYDVNLRKSAYNETIIRDSLKVCNIFKLNTDEVPVISQILTNKDLNPEQFCQHLIRLFPNVKTIIITASEKGCYVFDANGLVYMPGIAVKATDAVGAGDAFSAAFMHTFNITGNAVYAAGIGNHLGAYVATKSGAIPEYSESIKTLLSSEVKAFANAVKNI